MTICVPIPIPFAVTLFEIGTTVTFLLRIGTVVGTALIAYASYELGMYANNLINETEEDQAKNELEKKDLKEQEGKSKKT